MSRHQSDDDTKDGKGASRVPGGGRRERVTTLLSLTVLALGFAVVYLLFLRSLAPRGAVDFFPPTGDFTGTTTITTAYGYVCAASHVTNVATPPDIPTGTFTGVGMRCYPELYGDLQIPFGSEIVIVWVVVLAAFVALLFYLFRWSPTNIAKPLFA